MTIEQFSNLSKSTLAATISAAATSLTVAGLSSFPTVPQFRVLVDQEIMLVTAVAGTTFTVTRGIEGTVAASHASGATVTAVLTAASLQVASGWQTAFDLDFTSLATQTINGGADGTFTFSGDSLAYTWTKGNSANEATHASIVNGQGLNFQPASASEYNGATRTLPYIWLPFGQVFPAGSFTWTTRLRLWVSIGSDNLTANYDNEVFGIDSNSLGYSMLITRGVNAPAFINGSLLLFQVNAANGNNFMQDAYTLASYKTIMVDFENPAAEWFRHYRGAGIAAGAAFPALSSLIPTLSDYRYLSTNGGGVNANVQNFAPSGVTDPRNGLGIILGAKRVGSLTALSVNFQRVRLDFYAGT